MNKTKFCVGDRVKCISTRIYTEITKGKIYTLLEIGTDEDGQMCFSVLRDNGEISLKDTYESYLFELVEDYTWTSKFNLGDKVVYNSGVYEIIAVGFDSNEIWYKLDNDKISEDIWYIERNLKFYEEPKLYNMTFADATIEDVVKGLSEYIGKEKLRDLL